MERFHWNLWLRDAQQADVMQNFCSMWMRACRALHEHPWSVILPPLLISFSPNMFHQHHSPSPPTPTLPCCLPRRAALLLYPSISFHLLCLSTHPCLCPHPLFLPSLPPSFLSPSLQPVSSSPAPFSLLPVAPLSPTSSSCPLSPLCWSCASPPHPSPPRNHLPRALHPPSTSGWQQHQA